MGTFSVADAYLFTVLQWLPTFNIDVENWPVLATYIKRMAERPSVRSAIAAEQATHPV